MESKEKQLADIKNQIQSLNNEIGRLGGDAYKNLDKIFEGFYGDLKNAKTFVKQLAGEVSSLKDVFGTLSTTLKNVLADLKGTVDPAKQINRSFDKLENGSYGVKDKVGKIRSVTVNEEDADDDIVPKNSKRGEFRKLTKSKRFKKDM